jgi:hypothetical protein
MPVMPGRKLNVIKHTPMIFAGSRGRFRGNAVKRSAPEGWPDSRDERATRRCDHRNSGRSAGRLGQLFLRWFVDWVLRDAHVLPDVGLAKRD